MTYFKVGDVVKLKSGSPNMTIDKIYVSPKTKQPMNLYKCVWFEGTKSYWKDFKSEMLDIVIL